MNISKFGPAPLFFALSLGATLVAVPGVALQIDSSGDDPQPAKSRQAGSGQAEPGQDSAEKTDQQQAPAVESDPSRESAGVSRSTDSPSVDSEPATRFSPSEKIRADDAVSFPVDI